MNTTFKHENGKELKVINTDGTTALLEGWNKYTPYVVAYRMEWEAGTWHGGAYFKTLAEAERKYLEVTVW